MIYLSTAPASIPAGPYGTLGIDPTLAAPFPPVAIPMFTGIGSVGFTVPAAPGLIGLDLFSQAIVADGPNDVRLSNVVRDMIR